MICPNFSKNVVIQAWKNKLFVVFPFKSTALLCINVYFNIQ